ncbi:MAG: DinB family protein [Candidatus Dormibacteria bacterium]
MASKSIPTEQIVTQLADAPRRIAALTAGLAPSRLCTGPGDGEWSANDVLAHLRACADVWGDHISAIVAEDAPHRRGVNPRTWIKSTDYLELGFHDSLRSFLAQRAELLATLEDLSPDGWSRKAKVVAYGMTNERTLLSYAEHLARHERTHLKQIENIVDGLLGRSDKS